MGSCDFHIRSKGQTAREAFAQAQQNVCPDETEGTIAMKHSFIMLEVPEGIAPLDFAYKLTDENDPRISNKNGPAGCVRFSEGYWLFFGFARC